jgi:hypothetical protein
MPEDNAAVVAPPNDGPASTQIPAKEPAEPAQAAPAGEPADPQAPANEAGENKEEQKRKPGSVRQRERAERLAEENARLRTENEQLKKPPAAEPKPKPKPDDFRVKDDAGNLTDQYDVAAYTDALTDWKVDEKLAAAETKKKEEAAKATEQTEREAAEKAYTERMTARWAKAEESMPDFTDKSRECFATLQELAPDPKHTRPEEVQAALRRNPGIPALLEAINEYDDQGKLEYHLGSHPEEIERIAKLAPVAASVAIGKLFATLANDPEPDEMAAAAAAPAVSAAPPPLTPNRRTAQAQTVMPGQPGADKLSDEEWFKRRQKQKQARKNFQKR